ncbi:MAG: FMN-binding protein, partial [Lachnospiraceae bacterium]|nr:FMN-binding protein [Lachnospiraceae bacterium]
GMKADEVKFKNQFAGMKAEKIEYVKSGKSEDDQIDAISGATVTTNAVTNGVNTGILAFQFIHLNDENQKEGGESDE